MNVARITFSHRSDKRKRVGVQEEQQEGSKGKPPVIYDQLLSYLPPQAAHGKRFTGRGQRQGLGDNFHPLSYEVTPLERGRGQSTLELR